MPDLKNQEIDYTTYGLGCIPDEYDPRDYVYTPPAGASSTIYPISFRLKQMPIKNQQNINSCVAHACALIKEIQEYYETGRELRFSVGFLYGYRLSNQYQGEGMYPREALTNMLNIGNVLYDLFPENFEYNDIQPIVTAKKANCLKNAGEYKIKSYARVTDSNSVKAALYGNNSPVMVICNIYNNFYKVDGSGIVPNKSGTSTGSHAMVIIGWTTLNDKEYYVVQNSWGPEWADNGLCYIPTDSDIITDMYTSVDKENTTITFSDVTGGKHWAESYIKTCVKAGLINGYTDGTFKPNDTITRAEICTMFAKLLNK